VLEDQEGFFQFLMDIGVRMGNKRKRDVDHGLEAKPELRSDSQADSAVE
jgi:hypothetical protein